VSWSLRFPEPIVLPDGGKLTTWREAIAHLGKAIPKSDHEQCHRPFAPMIRNLLSQVPGIPDNRRPALAPWTAGAR
jgi:hypothetical protein